MRQRLDVVLGVGLGVGLGFGGVTDWQVVRSLARTYPGSGELIAIQPLPPLSASVTRSSGPMVLIVGLEVERCE